MKTQFPITGRNLLCAILAGLSLATVPVAGFCADKFPFGQELLLDAARMGRVKRVPMLVVEADGRATIQLWCKDARANVQIGDGTIHIEPGPLPDAFPQYMSSGQCSPERMSADVETLTAFAQVTEWRVQGGALVLNGPKSFRFRPSDH
jgi:heat shock protein HslJ